MDNTTAVSNINKRGGTKSNQLTQWALDIWELCQSHNIMLVADYLPGVQKCGSRSRITLNECQDRVDSCQTSVCKNTNTLLHPRSRPICIQTEPPSPIVCYTSPKSRGNSNRCVHFGLESVDIAHTPTTGSFEQNTTKGSSRQSDSLTDSAGTGETAVVPNAVEDAGRPASQTSVFQYHRRLFFFRSTRQQFAHCGKRQL